MKKVFLQLLNNPLISLLFRYGIVGVAASIVHFTIAYLAFEYLHVNYFYSIFFGFCFGLLTSYFGHYFYSFKDSKQHSERFPKFLTIAVIGFAIHQSSAYVLIEIFEFDFTEFVLPLLVVTVPVFSFLLNKFWVFSDKNTLKWHK